MGVPEVIALMGLMLSPIYGGLGYLVIRQQKNSRKISGIINILDDEFSHIDVEDELPEGL